MRMAWSTRSVRACICCAGVSASSGRVKDALALTGLAAFQEREYIRNIEKARQGLFSGQWDGVGWVQAVAPVMNGGGRASFWRVAWAVHFVVFGWAGIEGRKPTALSGRDVPSVLTRIAGRAMRATC